MDSSLREQTQIAVSAAALVSTVVEVANFPTIYELIATVEIDFLVPSVQSAQRPSAYAYARAEIPFKTSRAHHG